MDDLYRAFDDRAQVILKRIDAKHWDLLVGVIESTDRVQHMMWRLIDPTAPDVRRGARGEVRRLDRARLPARATTSSAKSIERVDPATPILIVSDHGFHSWRKSVNLNTWLVQEGYMALQGQQPGEKKLHDLFGGGTFWENVDWRAPAPTRWASARSTSTCAAAKAQGIVSPGAEATALADELSAQAADADRPGRRRADRRAVYKRDDIYTGPFLHNASELQVGMNDGYRVSWQTTLGGSPPGIVYPNMKKWSGDHGGYDYAITSGHAHLEPSDQHGGRRASWTSRRRC